MTVLAPQFFPLPFFGTLLDLLRIFMRFLDMKYGFSGDPSLRSRSSTVTMTDGHSEGGATAVVI